MTGSHISFAVAVLVAPLLSVAQPRAGLCWIKDVKPKGTAALVTFNDGQHVHGYGAAAGDLDKPLFHFSRGVARSKGAPLKVAEGVVVHVSGGPHSSCVLQVSTRLGEMGLLVRATESNTPSPPYYSTIEQFISLK